MNGVAGGASMDGRQGLLHCSLDPVASTSADLAASRGHCKCQDGLSVRKLYQTPADVPGGRHWQ
eukprot:NODE_3193_length_480_cov_2.923434_g2773_i0.p3 GENE.NODE_3193_length_480_cov_2.923434_g2773_i0~~NODE_3193_length_480_cov_2.923434_g2773_i0.p3  ORF type:complete len:64 (+),score=5.22 NODE_3193_length_480_cov_2.923434_g2773_i0:64-255(+)